MPVHEKKGGGGGCKKEAARPCVTCCPASYQLWGESPPGGSTSTFMASYSRGEPEGGGGGIRQ
jgi:hypothetical protein